MAHFHCPSCHRSLRSGSITAGSTVLCPGCKARLVVPPPHADFDFGPSETPPARRLRPAAQASTSLRWAIVGGMLAMVLIAAVLTGIFFFPPRLGNSSPQAPKALAQVQDHSPAPSAPPGGKEAKPANPTPQPQPADTPPADSKPRDPEVGAPTQPVAPPAAVVPPHTEPPQKQPPPPADPTDGGKETRRPARLRTTILPPPRRPPAARPC